MTRLIIEVQPNGCWLWKRGRTTAGYGVIWPNSKPTYVHRFIYEAAYGPISDGLHIDHLCRTPSCINPGHLETVTPMVNIQRGNGQTHPVRVGAANRLCIHGHWMDEAATYIDSRGRTRCRRCAAERGRRKRLPEREEVKAT